MVEINALMVKELRERTGSGMMDCKNTLVETEGDIEKAIDLLRKNSHVGTIEPDYAYRASENVKYNGLGENSTHDQAPDTIETSFSVAVLFVCAIMYRQNLV